MIVVLGIPAKPLGNHLEVIACDYPITWYGACRLFSSPIDRHQDAHRSPDSRSPCVECHTVLCSRLVLFCNNPKLFGPNYKIYLENKIRQDSIVSLCVLNRWHGARYRLSITFIPQSPTDAHRGSKLSSRVQLHAEFARSFPPDS